VTNLLPTKFYLPPLPGGFVARPQLLQILDEAVKHRLTLVSAPAGAGKTTLVSAWAQSARKKGVAFGWLSLDEADNDPGRFMECLVACLEEWGIILETSMRYPKGGEQIQPENIPADFIRGLTNLKRDTTIIVDDYHLIQNREVHAILEYLLEHASLLFHLMLLTRSDPPFELARLRVSGQLVELRIEQLRFSMREAGAFLRKAAGVQLTETDIAVLNERTEGWVAGLQMAAISLRGREDASAFVAAFAGSHRFVLDYLLEQVLNRQSSEVQEFLLKTSILERLSAPLCDAVIESSGMARGLLDTLERANLFLIPLDDERGWYRYHHLFADLLENVLEQSHPDLLVGLHRRACRWHEAQGMLPEALHHALEAGDNELVARMVSANMLAIVEHAELAPILLHMDAVPRAERITLPWLGVAYAWGLAYAGQNERAGLELSLAEKQADKLVSEERSRLLGHIAAVRAYLAWSNGDQPEAVIYAEQAAHLLPAEEIAVRALNLTTLGNAMTQYAADTHAVEVLEQAMLLARQGGQSHVFMLAAGAMAFACKILGQFHRAYEVCEDAIEVAGAYQRSNRRELTAAASIYAFLSRVLSEWGELEKAIRVARKGLALSELWGQADTIMVCLLYLAQALALAGEAESSQQVLQRARKIAQKISPWHMINVDLAELDTCLDGGTSNASEVYQEAIRKQNAGYKFPDFLAARLLLRQNRANDVLILLERALPEAQQHPSYENVRLYTFQALAHFQKKDFPHALVSLDQALDLAEPENRLATFVREGDKMEKLLQLAQANSMHPEFIQCLLAVFEIRRKYKAEPAPGIEQLIEPLSARELEILNYLNGYLSSMEIAEQLVVSVNTVRTHMKNIYGKLGVHGRSAAVRRAKELGLVK